MKRFLVATALLLGLAAPAMSQAPPDPDLRSFEISAAVPSTPILKHQLYFDFVDRIPGNAAIAYLDAILLMGPEANDKADKALKAYNAKDMTNFATLADALDLPSMIEELDVAGRREQCDWNPPIRERGERTLLPHLNPLTHGIARVLKVRALRQIQQGKLDDALRTLRLGYELADKVGQEPTLISSLVSLAIIRWMNDGLAVLMNHPNAPSLYWALTLIPPRQNILRKAWDGESTTWLAGPGRAIVKTRAGEKIPAEQWHKLLTEELAAVAPHLHAIKDATPQILRSAREQYAQTHGTTEAQAAAADPAAVLGEFYLRQYLVAADEVAKLRGLPYPVCLARSREYRGAFEKLKTEQRSNGFLHLVFIPDAVVMKFAWSDRQLAALSIVEALRIYAAANAGSLPSRLEDIIDTPVPLNPFTGKPFEYKKEKDTATLADSESPSILTYTIKLRK